FAITKATLTVTVDADDTTSAIDHFSKVYGSANPPFGVRYVGFVGSDTPASLGGTLAFSTTATASSPVATYGVSASGLTSANYAITFVDGFLDITKASSTTVVSCPVSVVYTGAAQTPCSVTVTGAGGLSLTPTPSYTNNVLVGTASASYTYAGDANHFGSSDSTTFAINAAHTSLTVG